MCGYHTLYNNEQEGHVIYCDRCDTVQLAFGNIAITVTLKDFYALIEWAGSLLPERLCPGQGDQRSIVLATPYQGIKILLTPGELQQLQHMLEAAECELQALELLRLFDQTG